MARLRAGRRGWREAPRPEDRCGRRRPARQLRARDVRAGLARVAPRRRSPRAGHHRARRRAVRRPPVGRAQRPPRPRRRPVQAGLAPLVVVTGGKQAGDRFTEAEASANYLADKGVPGGAIERETTSTNSYDELAAAARFLHQRGINDVILVSDPFHAYRINAIAHDVGLNARVADTDEPGARPRQRRGAAARDRRRVGRTARRLRPPRPLARPVTATAFGRVIAPPSGVV